MVEAPAAWLPVAVLAPMEGRAVSLGLSGVGDGRGHVSVVGVLTVNVFMVDMLVIGKLMVNVFMVNMFMVGGLMVRVGGGRRRSGTAVSMGNCIVDGELLKTSVL